MFVATLLNPLIDGLHQASGVPAEQVIEREAAVNTYLLRLDEEQLVLIARRQPVASDLKAILAMSRAVAELERCGDEAKKIARTVLRHGGRPGVATSRDARHLGRLAVDLLHLALQAFDRLDSELAAEVIARDPELDANFPEIVLRAASRMLPRLSCYIGSIPRERSHYGGYYAMTRENWPLIGASRTPGVFLATALSGYGTMAACATGDLCARAIAGAALPMFARSLSLERLNDQALMSRLESSEGRGLL